MVAVDVFSRYVRVEFLKSKNAETTKAAFIRVCFSNKTDTVFPKKFWTDSFGGNSDTSAIMFLWKCTLHPVREKPLLPKKPFAHWKQLYVGSLRRDKMNDFYLTFQKKWIQWITVNSATNIQPSKVTTAAYRNKKVEIKLWRKTKNKFSIEDRIRIANLNYVFNIGYWSQYTDEFFTITSIGTKTPVVTYHLKNFDNERIDGNFCERELSKFIGVQSFFQHFAIFMSTSSQISLVFNRSFNILRWVA